MPEYEIRLTPKDGKPQLMYFATFPGDEAVKAQAKSIRDFLNATFEIWHGDQKIFESEK